MATNLSFVNSLYLRFLKFDASDTERQALTKEIRIINKRGLGTKISLDTSIFLEDKNSTVEEMIYNQLVSQDSYQYMTTDSTESRELLNEMLAEVGSRLYYHIRISRFFGLIVAFPNISRVTLSKLLNVEITILSNYYFVVRGCIKQVAKEYGNILYERRNGNYEEGTSFTSRELKENPALKKNKPKPKAYIFDTESAKESLEQYFINHSLYE